MSKTINTRIKQKHATETEWLTSSLIPLDGEIIIYDEDTNYNYKRVKIGDGITLPINLPFLVSDAYINYEELAFNTNELIIELPTSSVLGQAMLGQLVLA